MPGNLESSGTFELTATEHGVAPSDWALPASLSSGDDPDINNGQGAWCCCCCCCVGVYVD